MNSTATVEPTERSPAAPTLAGQLNLLESNSTVAPPRSSTVGATSKDLLDDLVYLFVDPERTFRTLPSINRSALALVLFIGLQALIGFGIASTDVYDYEIGTRTEKNVAKLMLQNEHEDDTATLEVLYDQVEKLGRFEQLVTRTILMFGNPIGLLVDTAWIAAYFFIVVSITAGKPKFPLLFGVVAFANLPMVLRQAVTLILTASMGRSKFELNLAALIDPNPNNAPLFLALRLFDPFVWAYWYLVYIGMYSTGQLSKRASFWGTLILAFLSVTTIWALSSTNYIIMPEMSSAKD